MFKTHILLFLSAFLFLGNSFTTEPYIEVNGFAEIEVIPDEIYIEIVIKEQYLNRTKLTIEEQEEKLKSALQNINIDLENLYLSDAIADYVRVSWQKKDVITQKNYTLKVSDAASVGQVFQELNQIEINEAYFSKISHSKIDSLRKKVRIKAISDAKNKADYLLNSIGENTGKAMAVRENNTNNTNHSFIGQRKDANAYFIDGMRLTGNNLKELDKAKEIEFKKIKLASSIYVKFAIE